MKVTLLTSGKVDLQLSNVLDVLFDDINIIDNTKDAIDSIYTDPPDLILVEDSFARASKGNIIQELKGNTVYGHLPVVLMVDREEIKDISLEDIFVDDFIIIQDKPIAIEQRLRFTLSRMQRDLDTSPLTQLSGNQSIIRYIQRMFDEGQKVAIAWADIDHFKSFNDSYGFSRGDEVILATARIIVNSVEESKIEPLFVGHIGGDDFVFICPIFSCKHLCEEIISRFDMIMPNFYNEDDREKGEIFTKDRKGQMKKFPIMSISIAVVLNKGALYKHYGEALQDATEIKSYIKTLSGSNYMIDRRREQA
ncbi:MAG: diguanylate cyclase [Thermodesulfobacteriota bacterium]|nr:diguanylate cyclase [Thermodesulfobacteriota bacterium]